VPYAAADPLPTVPETTLPEKILSLEPAEELLALASEFTRFCDSHLRHKLNGNNPVAMLITQTDAAQNLAHRALSIVTTLNAQSVYHSPAIRAVYARVRQLAHLATDAADHLITAEDILLNTQAGLPVELGDDFLAVLTEKEARQEAGRRFTLVAELMALGASDAVATAELYVADRRHRGYVPDHQPPVLSRTQSTALRAIARGDVTITDNRPCLRRDDIRVSISTIRSLESRGMVARAPSPLWFHDERVHLTPDGYRDLAAAFGRARPPALAAARPAHRPVTSAARATTR
jgi:hypothetical protein